MSCSIRCWAMPVCVVCGRRKSPRGRDVAAAESDAYCNNECPGYISGTDAVGHYWPGEHADECGSHLGKACDCAMPAKGGGQ